MEIQTNDYRLWYETETQTVTCQGSLRLGGMEEYAPIVQLLGDVVEQQPAHLTLDLRKLTFLNSSGINVLSKFVIKVRQAGKIKLVLQGSQDVPWQGKSLKNLQRLMPELQLEIE